MINAGRLTERVTLQARQGTQNALGEAVGAWVDIATVWAEVAPLRGREYFASGQMQSTVEVKVTIRNRPDVVPTMRVVHRGVPHEIVSVIDPKSEGEGLELMCTAGIRDGRA